jgi:hypothetical protein
MAQANQPSEAVFRSILPEEIDWKPFAAFPPSARLAVAVASQCRKALVWDSNLTPM